MKANALNTGNEGHRDLGPKRGIELPALVPITWSLAGGMLGGGASVAILAMTGGLSGHVILAASAAFFIVGAMLGLLHGVVLAVLGRPEGVTPRQALAGMAHGLIYLVPLLLVGWLTAGWTAALPIALNGDHVVATGISIVAWLLTVVAIVAAGGAGVDAIRLAYARWPDRVPGTILVAASFVALAVSFSIERPMLWFVNLELTTFGAIIFAFGLTIWFYGPIITVGLALLRRVAPLRPRIRYHTPRGWFDPVVRGMLAVATGLFIALLALPFYAGATGLPTTVERFGVGQAVALALGDAVADELLLRLFLFTAVFVVVAQYLPARHVTSGKWAVALAVAIAALADMLLHAPQVAALGLPGLGLHVSYVLARLAFPAILFGYLFWRRGLGTAMAAHATANAAVGILLMAV